MQQSLLIFILLFVPILSFSKTNDVVKDCFFCKTNTQLKAKYNDKFSFDNKSSYKYSRFSILEDSTKKEKKSSFLDNLQPEFLGKKEFNIAAGMGFFSNVKANKRTNYTGLKVPALHFSVEKGFKKFWGWGLYLGYAKWEESDILNYNYWAVGTRVNFHFPIVEKLDVYLGSSFTVRWITAQQNCYKNTNFGYSYNFPLGIKYRLFKQGGVFFEAGSEAVTKYKLGAYYRF